MSQSITELSSEDLHRIFEKIGRNLNHPSRLVLIGSSVGMLHGQPSRMTEDVDVWSPSSVMDYADMKEACEKAGVLFDPKDACDGAYLQLVQPGIVQIGNYRKDGEIRISVYGNLEVAHPPVENVVASKLLRAEERDIQDVMFLMKKFAVRKEDVERAIDSFPEHRAETARENLVYLDIAMEVWDEGKASGCHP